VKIALESATKVGRILKCTEYAYTVATKINYYRFIIPTGDYKVNVAPDSAIFRYLEKRKETSRS